MADRSIEVTAEDDPKKRDHTQWILIDMGTGAVMVEAAPGGWATRKERRIIRDRQSFEHVDTDPYGRWVFRVM